MVRLVRPFIAASLAALVAVLGCCQHAWHSLLHQHALPAFAMVEAAADPTTADCSSHSHCQLKHRQVPSAAVCQHATSASCCSGSRQAPQVPEGHCGAGTVAETGGEKPAPHDENECLVCRFFALPQLCQVPPGLHLSVLVREELVCVEPPGLGTRTVLREPIRGPPALS